MKNIVSLKSLIYKSYLSSALVPVFAIEAVLLVLYFGVTYFISQKSQEILLDEARSALSEIAYREAGVIDMIFTEVSRDMAIMRQDHEMFFASKECRLPNGEAEFARHQNGALYKLKDNGGSSIYAPKHFEATPSKMQKVKCSESIDPLMKSIVDTNPVITQAYINTYDKLNRLYPFMSDAPSQYGSDLDATTYNFYYLADDRHNPSRKSVWTSAYLDPAGQGWMISHIVPIYSGDLLEGVSGLDVTIDSLIKNVLTLKIPWNGSAFLVDEEGTIIAMPKNIENLLSLKELKEHTYTGSIQTTIEKPKEFNLLKNSNGIKSFFENKTPIKTFSIKGANYIFSQESIPQTNWRMIVVVDESVIYKPIKEFKAQAQNIGYVVIALMVFFYIMFFIFLMRKSKIVAKHISKPINELSELTDNLGIRPNTLLKDTSNIAEIAKLAENFNMLSSELENRTNAYIESQMREKLKEKEACAAYKEGLIESTGGYLHNVGNSLAVLDAKLLMLQSVVTSLQKSELGFKRAIEMMQNSQAKSEEKNALILFLEEFNDILSEETTAQIVDISNGIQRVKNHATEMIRHQQDRFANREIKESYIYSFSLNEMLENIIEDYRLECLRNGISVEFAGDGDIVLRSMKYRLQSGVANVLKNAIESILLFKQRGEGKINITLKKEDKKAVIQIKDNGAGVDEENIEKIFSFGYTTKKGGNGFGLHALNNFLNSIGGSITMKNNDHEDGVTVNMEILIDEKI